ncbi:hypothetical protein HZB00_00855 [Candidatus Woesearchaeota archaeon]|nr:hypothetical protein [Candidatus Woesearchaeota archaeon]
MKAAVSRIPTGISGFDSLVQGGFKKNSINLVAGGAGSGKTIFAIQFLVQGALQKNEPGVYITFEEKKEKLYEDMLDFGWDLEKLEKEGKFIFLEYTPEQVKKVLIEGGGTIEAVIAKTKAKRLVIDSITSFALLYQEELSKKEASLALFDLITDWGCTAVLTSEDDDHKGSFIAAALEFEVDSIILLYYVKQKGARVRAMEILKMRGTKHPGKTFAFNITDKGVVIDTKKQVIF